MTAEGRPVGGEDAMARLMVRHSVSDYSAWRKVYDDFDDTRGQMGVTAQAVFRSVDDPADLTVTHDFATTEQAKAFASSAELRAAMQQAGVVGKPEIWFVDEA
jgi:hypothetical protein